MSRQPGQQRLQQDRERASVSEVLPKSSRKLATRNVIRVRPNPDFRSDLTRLIEVLEEHFRGKEYLDHPGSALFQS